MLKQTRGKLRAGSTVLIVAAALLVAGTAAVSPAEAASSPSQQWATSATAPVGTGVGATRTISFGASGITAVETTTATTGSCLMAAAAAVGAPANMITYLEPDPPATAPSIGMLCSGPPAGPPGSSRTSTLTFSKPVSSPVIHVVNLDASRFTISGTSTTGDAIALTPIAKNNALEIVGDTLNATPQAANRVGCLTDAGANPNGGCGSIQLSAATGLVQTITMTNSTIGNGIGGSSANDGWGYLLSFPTASLTKAFSPTTITQGATSQLTFSISNPADPGQPTLTGLDFTDSLPAGVTLADGTATPSASCGPATVTGPGGAALAAGGSSVTAGDISIAPGATCTITVTVTATVVDTYTNNNANITTSVANLVPNADATLTVLQAPTASISLVKSATPDDSASFTVGRQIDYSFVVTNTGGATLANPSVVEGAFTGAGTPPSVTCPATPSLAPAAQMTCTATYVLTQADIDAGFVSNDAIARATPPVGTAIDSQPSQAVIPGVRSPALTVAKTADRASFTAAGQQIAFSFLITNTGNVTLSNVSAVEGAFTGSGAQPVPTCPAGAASLAPGATVTCTATYVVTQADVDAGSVSNDAIARGTPPAAAAIDSAPSTVTVPSVRSAALTLVKTSDATAPAVAGQQVVFSFLITNTGNVTVSNVSAVEGVFTGSAAAPTPVCPAGAAALAPAASVTCTASYTVTAADVAAGGFSNTASALGTAPTGAVASADSTAEIEVVPPPVVVPPPTVPVLGHTGADIGTPALFGLVALALGLLLLVGVRVARGRRASAR